MMIEDLDFTPFIQFGEGDVIPGTPHLTLELTAPSHLSLTLPYQIRFNIRRAHDNGQDKKCIFQWGPNFDSFYASGFILLRHTQEGLEVVPDDHSGLLPRRKEDAIVVNGRNQFLQELSPGESTQTAVGNPPERYYCMLRAGETYTLLHPGKELSVWDWGGVQEHMGQKIGKDAPRPGCKLIIPGGAHLTFTTGYEKVSWPDRANVEKKEGFSSANWKERMWRLEQSRIGQRTPSPIRASERLPYTPILKATFECPATITCKEPFEVTLKVKYEGIVGQSPESSSRPIIFHTWVLVDDDYGDKREGFRLYRSRDKRKTWERCEAEDDNGCRLGKYLLVDDPDIEVSVAQDDMKEHFVSLKPGEVWTKTQRLQAEGWSDLPNDATPGDVFRYSLKGALVDWWDWGSMDEHKDTFVKLYPWRWGKVTDPSNNGGRPRLVIPESNPAEFTLVEGTRSRE